MSGEDIGRLTDISHSRTEPASRVERAQMLLAYQEKPSFCAVGEKLRDASSDGATLRRTGAGLWRLAALDDRPRPSRRKPRPVGVAGVRQGQGARLCARIMDDTAFGPPRARARTGGGARMPRPPGARHGVQDPRPRGNQAAQGALLSIATTAPDLPPEPGVHATLARAAHARAVCGAASSMGWPPQRSVPLLSDFDARSKGTGAR
jgi:hypothetical protein